MAETVNDLREILVKSGQYSQDDLKGKSKPELKEMVDVVRASGKILDSAEAVLNDVNQLGLFETNQVIDSSPPQPEKVPEVKLPEKPPILPTDPLWSDYVMGFFTPAELDNNNPRTDALRRVAELLLGPFNILSEVIQWPELANRATVMVKLEFLRDKTTGTSRIVSGAADVSSVNTDSKFAVHPVATAETRAEGRALRKALRLTKVLAAEETYGADKDEPSGNDNRIETGMTNSLKMMCNKMGIDESKLSGYMFKASQLVDLTAQQGREMGFLLGDFRSGKSVIPEDVKL